MRFGWEFNIINHYKTGTFLYLRWVRELGVRFTVAINATQLLCSCLEYIREFSYS